MIAMMEHGCPLERVFKDRQPGKDFECPAYGSLLPDARQDKDLPGTLIADNTVINQLSFIVRKEREVIRKRQAEGITAARARGVHLGRPVKEAPENFGVLVKHRERGKLPLPLLLEQTGLKKATFYRRLREFQAAGNNTF